jgi:leucyl-tRNA synthetase
VKLVSPFAPHLGEEMWQQLGHAESLAYAPWPHYEEALTISNTVTLGVQVNGKTRGEITLSTEASEDEARELAAKVESVAKFVEGKELKKFIYRPGKIINFVVGN